MTNRRLLRLLCAALACLTLTGCSAPEQVIPPVPTLPAASSPHSAPVGDAGLSHEALAALHLPSADGQQLLTFYETLTFTYSQHPAETVLRALLSHPGNSRVRSLGGGVSLALTGSDPVAVAGGVCTLNLSASALQLSQQDFYTVCQAMTATLCELDGIRHVNILVAGRAIAMDVAGYLPIGSLAPQAGQELPVLWEQLTARRTPVGVHPTAVPLTAVATLYFPLADGTGILPQTRRLSFAGQHPQQLTLALMEALSQGAEDAPELAELPDLIGLLEETPAVTDLDNGGKRVTLRFSQDVKSWMSAGGADPACCFAALVTTLTTFIPSLQEVEIIAGERPVTSVVNALHGSLLLPGGVHTRQNYAGYLRELTTTYCPEDGRIASRPLSLPYREARSPRSLLLRMADAQSGSAVLPAGLTDADVLGLAITGDTLLIHLSSRYADVIRLSGADQRLTAYAVVNTMCDALKVRRVRFFFGGTQADTLDGELLWSGEFLYNPGLIRR